jgi:hypothetical protein
MLVSGILGDGLTFLLRSRRNNPTSGPVSPRFMVRIYESSTSEPQNCTTTSQAVNLRQSCPSFHFIMPPSSSQSDTIAGLHLPDIAARSLSYFMLGALTDALTDAWTCSPSHSPRRISSQAQPKCPYLAPALGRASPAANVMDLTNRRFGRLTVLACGRRARH